MAHRRPVSATVDFSESSEITGWCLVESTGASSVWEKKDSVGSLLRRGVGCTQVSTAAMAVARRLRR